MSALIRSFSCFSALSLFLVFALGAQNSNSTKPPETVCVRIIVHDPLGRYVTGLSKESFRIYEDKAEQTIASFSQQEEPMSFGIVWDISRSKNRGESMESAKAAVSHLLRSRGAENECFFINFSESAPIQTIIGNMLPVEVQIDKSKKRIALFDAVYMGLDRISQSRHDKRALLVISDGEETYSQHKASEIRKYAMESDVQIYGIGEPGSLANTLQNIASSTGGSIYRPNSFNELKYYIDHINDELRNQFLLCYTPTNNKHDGTWRKIEIKLDLPPKLPKLTFHAREGRYAPKN
jgi:Ca-activated chloride channel homolog